MARLWSLNLAVIAISGVWLIVGTPEARGIVPAFSMYGPSSWYGGPCDGSDNNIPAYAPQDRNRTPGIALRRKDTARGFYLLTLVKTGRKVVVWHTDYGPAAWTGKMVDLNYRTVQALGYSGCRDDYPTGSSVKLRYLTKKRIIRKWVSRTKTQVDDRLILRRLK